MQTFSIPDKYFFTPSAPSLSPPKHENGKVYVEVGMSDKDLDSTRYKFLEIYIYLNKTDQLI